MTDCANSSLATFFCVSALFSGIAKRWKHNLHNFWNRDHFNANKIHLSFLMNPWVVIGRGHSDFENTIQLKYLLPRTVHVGPEPASNCYSFHYSTSLWPFFKSPPPAPSSPLVMRHILPSAEWFLFHLIWTLKKELNPPERLLPVPSENSISLVVAISKVLKPFCSIVNWYSRSQLGLSAGWVMPPIKFFVRGHQHFIFWLSMCSYLVWYGGMQFCPWSLWLDS